jgi:GNAT superfamily N-acetyltransferase
MRHEDHVTEDDVQIRWLIRRDFDEVQTIDRTATRPFGWPLLLDIMSQRTAIGRVAECRLTHEIVGLKLERFHTRAIELVYLAVLPGARRNGIATRLLDNCKSRLLAHHEWHRGSLKQRNRIVCDMDATIVDLHCTLAGNRFRVLSVDNDADRYRFVWLPCFERE